MRKSSMLQRALKHGAHNVFADTLYLESLKETLRDGVLPEEWIDSYRKDIKKTKLRIKQLAELQVFLKQQLQQAYVMEQIEERWHNVKVLEALMPMEEDYKHAPQFMDKAPPAELGSFVEDEQ